MRRRHKWWKTQSPEAIGDRLTGFLALVGRTLRIRMENWEPVEALSTGKIISGWHGRSFVAAYRYRRLGYWVIISNSKDGNIQNRIFENLGFKVIRGSTGRGGVRALVESIRVLRDGATMAITPDGPRGPSGVVQDGIMMMAQKSGCAIVPVGISAKPRILIKSWDRYMIPLPFAKAIMRFGSPVYVPADATPEAVEELRLRVQSEMHRLQDEVERTLGQRPLVHVAHPRKENSVSETID